MTEDEFILIAEDKEEIIGAVRLVKEEETNTLRGMFIEEKFQRQGLGKRMLYELKSTMGTNEYYCLSRTHLEDFYGLIGFRKVSFDLVPGHLRKRYDKVRLKYDVIAMRKESREA